MPKLKWEYQAMADYMAWQGQDRKMLRKLNRLLTELQRDPCAGVGKFEKLKWLVDTYSRRIDDANRLVYRYDGGDTVEILSCKGHYGDK